MAAYGDSTKCLYWAGGSDPFYTNARITEAIVIADAAVDQVNDGASATLKAHASNIYAGTILAYWKSLQSVLSKKPAERLTPRLTIPPMPMLAEMILRDDTILLGPKMTVTVPNDDGTW